MKLRKIKTETLLKPDKKTKQRLPVFRIRGNEKTSARDNTRTANKKIQGAKNYKYVRYKSDRKLQ